MKLSRALASALEKALSLHQETIFTVSKQVKNVKTQTCTLNGSAIAETSVDCQYIRE